MATVCKTIPVTPGGVGAPISAADMAAEKTIVVTNGSGPIKVEAGINGKFTTIATIATNKEFNVRAVCDELRVDATKGSGTVTVAAERSELKTGTVPADGTPLDVTGFGPVSSAVSPDTKKKVKLEISQDHDPSIDTTNGTWQQALKPFSNDALQTGDFSACYARSMPLRTGGETDDIELASQEAAISGLTEPKNGYVYAPNKTPSGNVYTDLSEILSIHAQGILEATANPAEGDTVTIDGVTYTFTAAPAAPGDVLIGADARESLIALRDCIRNINNPAFSSGFAATNYFPTPPLFSVFCEETDIGGGDKLLVWDRISGQAQNGAIAVSATGAALSWDVAALEGGSDGAANIGGDACNVNVCFDPSDDDGNLPDPTGRISWPVAVWDMGGIIPLGGNTPTGTDPAVNWPNPQPRAVLEEGTVFFAGVLRLGGNLTYGNAVTRCPVIPQGSTFWLGSSDESLSSFGNVVQLSESAPFWRDYAEPLNPEGGGFGLTLIVPREGRFRNLGPNGDGSVPGPALIQHDGVLKFMFIFSEDTITYQEPNVYGSDSNAILLWQTTSTALMGTQPAIAEGGIAPTLVPFIPFPQFFLQTREFGRFAVFTENDITGPDAGVSRYDGAAVAASGLFALTAAGEINNAGSKFVLPFDTDVAAINQLLPPIRTFGYIGTDIGYGVENIIKKMGGANPLTIDPGVSIEFGALAGGQFSPGDTVTFAGGPGTGIVQISGDDTAGGGDNGEIFIEMVTGPIPSPGDSIDNGGGVTATASDVRAFNIEGDDSLTKLTLADGEIAGLVADSRECWWRIRS